MHLPVRHGQVGPRSRRGHRRCQEKTATVTGRMTVPSEGGVGITEQVHDRQVPTVPSGDPTVVHADDAPGATCRARGASSAQVGSSIPPKLHLPLEHLDAALFDLDGVVTDTASLHERAWVETFDDTFASLASAQAVARRHISHADYLMLIDGRPRLQGVLSVLADRHLDLPDGSPEDGPGAESAWAIANAKDRRYLELLRSVGPRPFASSIALLQQLRRSGILTALVTGSRHGRSVLECTGTNGLFDAVVDAQAVSAMKLVGKPAPDTFLEASVRLGSPPERAVIFEDSVAGVQAGRRGGFGRVVGVDRVGDGSALLAAGAHAVVSDLGYVVPDGTGPGRDAWHLQEDEVDAEREGIRETLYTLGNGFLATRGARTYVAADATTHYPGTYVAGTYNRTATTIGDQPVEREAIVNAPNWLPLRFSVDGGPLTGDGVASVTSSRVRLDMRRGLLERRYKVVAEGKVTSVLERRLVSMALPHLAAIELTLVAENWSGVLAVYSGIDGRVSDTETVEERLLAHPRLEIVGSGEESPDLIWLAARTPQSQITFAEAARTRLSSKETSRTFVDEPGQATHVLTAQLERGGRLSCEKVVAVYTSRDFAISEPIGAARAAARRAGGFASLLADHKRAWAEIWRRGSIVLPERHLDVQRVIDVNRFHLRQVASPRVVDRDIGLGARGLHGEGYLGHVFWDEVFILPVLNLRFPEVARALLSYRSRRLDEARHAARREGHAGAMYPWQSGSSGRDETPTMLYNPLSGRWIPDCSRRQRHVGLAVAFDYWQYWQATGDTDYLVYHGAEVLLEIARFFASLAGFDEALDRFRIRGVMGPDEFHDGYPEADEPGVDDNAYTNVMAAWLFTRMLELVEILDRRGGRETLDHLGCTTEELARFEELSHRLYVPFFDGILAQFDRYETLEPIDLDAYRARYGNIGRLDLILEAEGDSVRRYQVAKQPDVLMLLYLFSAEELGDLLRLLGYQLTATTIRRTVDFYSARVTHGSSLSRVVHSWVAARSDREVSWDHFSGALSLDIYDSQGGTTREGIHLGAMAGTIDILTRCYSGLEVRADALWLNPRLPRELDGLAFAIEYRGHMLDLAIDREGVSVESKDGPPTPATIIVQSRTYLLRQGERLRHPLH